METVVFCLLQQKQKTRLFRSSGQGFCEGVAKRKIRHKGRDGVDWKGKGKGDTWNKKYQGGSFRSWLFLFVGSIWKAMGVLSKWLRGVEGAEREGLVVVALFHVVSISNLVFFLSFARMFIMAWKGGFEGF